MFGYWRRPEATVETMRGRWLHTGNAGRLAAEGCRRITDRIKDVIVSGRRTSTRPWDKECSPLGHARRLIFFGETIGPDEAPRLGLVDHLVAAEQVDAGVELAARYAAAWQQRTSKGIVLTKAAQPAGWWGSPHGVVRARLAARSCSFRSMRRR